MSGPYSDPIETKSKVLQEREQLETTLQDLQSLIRANVAKMDELQLEKKQHKDFTYQVQITKQRKIDLPAGQYTTNCRNCNYNCHYLCPYPSDDDKYMCSAMNNPGSRNATCTVCPGRCSWMYHKNNPYRFELYQEYETRTSDELRARYDSAKSEKNQVELKMEQELKEMYQAILQKTEQVKQNLQHLP